MALAELEARILERGPMTLDEIAVRMGVCRQRIQQQIATAMTRMARHAPVGLRETLNAEAVESGPPLSWLEEP